MARAAKLKVYRTPIGFHDAYVAAPSQKAALAAWGSDADLFARGIAERVDDPELAREPLENPDTVVRRSRGTTAEQLAALLSDRPRKPQLKADSAKPRPTEPHPKPKPRPSRTGLDAAEAAIAEADRAYADQRAALVEAEKRLARERRRLDDDHAAERDELEERHRMAEAAYARALTAWRG